MKGFVPTPDAVVDRMIEKLFAAGPPAPGSKVLDPGAGRGAFVEGLLRWCRERSIEIPRIAAVESDPSHARFLRERYAGERRVAVVERDFLTERLPTFDYVIGNPPYVSITGLSADERATYRDRYVTARGRFDLYILFFERALRLLSPGGTLVFITPEKYLYVETAAPLRDILSKAGVRELDFVDDETFPGLVTYPLVTTISARDSGGTVSIIHRDGKRSVTSWAPTRRSWLPLIHCADAGTGSLTLGDICKRISCGVATGADSVFVIPRSRLESRLKPFAHPTVAGRQIIGSDLPLIQSSMLLPYDEHGALLPEGRLGALGEYLNEPSRKAQLLGRTCVARKPWYAFHETPPLADMIAPKVLCKDIGATPTFVLDPEGAIVPRHSVYYIVPKNPERLGELLEYLSSGTARKWLQDNCQRAAGGFLRLQSHVLKALPVPPEFAVGVEQLSLDPDLTMRRSA